MSVAIRAITRLQDADDAPALGAGQDGYALTWDNASGAFVATALSAGVTDHGALTGLTDDDHTQYALLAGRAGGQTMYGGNAANDDVTIHGTSNATRTTSYVLLQPSGGNVGIGTTAPATTCHVLATSAITSAVGNVVTVGHDTTGTAAAGFGVGVALQLESSTTAAQNAALIAASWIDATHASRTSKVAFQTVSNAGALTDALVLGYGGIGIGGSPTSTAKANIVSSGSDTSNQYGTSISVTSLHSTGNKDEVIGTYNDVTQQGAGTVSNLIAMYNSVKTNTSAPATANGCALMADAVAYVTSSSMTCVYARGWGQPTAGATLSNGYALRVGTPYTTGTLTNAYGLHMSDITGATNNYAIYTGRGDVRLMSNTADKLGFHGATPVAQQVLATGAGATVDNVITALQNLGLVKQS